MGNRTELIPDQAKMAARYGQLRRPEARQEPRSSDFRRALRACFGDRGDWNGGHPETPTTTCCTESINWSWPPALQHLTWVEKKFRCRGVPIKKKKEQTQPAMMTNVIVPDKPKTSGRAKRFCCHLSNCTEALVLRFSLGSESQIAWKGWIQTAAQTN